MDSDQRSPANPILDQLLARYGFEDERKALLHGETFGSAIANARKLRKVTISALLASNAALAPFLRLQWNDIEQDRFDPRTLPEPAFYALETALGIPIRRLKELAGQYEQANREQMRLWNLLTLEAHAFRAKRDRD